MALASVSFTLDIPDEVLVPALKGTAYEGTVLGEEPDFERERIGEILDEWVADELPDLLSYMHNAEPDVEVDW